MIGRKYTSDDFSCDMRGLLSFLMLFLLSRRPMHGKEIADEIEVRRGYRPSPGTIYPALKTLRVAGLIKEKRCGQKIIYELTATGEKSYRIAKIQFYRSFVDVFQSDNEFDF